jgi:subtilisin family serine protease
MKKISAIFAGFFLIFFSIYAEDFREGEVLVELKSSEISASGIQTKSFIKTLKTNDANIKVKSIFSHGKKQIFLVKSDIYSTQELIEKMKKNPHVYRVEPNYTIKPLVFPNDSEYANNDYSKFWGLDKIQAFDAWDITTGSNDVVIAVIDTGIDYTHPDLADNIWRNEIECSGVDNEDDDGNGYIDDCIGYDMHDRDNDPVDYDGHGTHVAGIIGAVGNNNLGISGVNWRVKLLPCKIFDNDGGGNYVLSAAIECLNYIVKLKKRGVNIVASNNSWAASPGVYLGDILKDAIQESVNAGILFITAAGNEGSNNDKTCISDPYCQHVYPCDYELDNDGIICVTATDQNDELPWYANYGVNSVDIAAPGDAVYSATTTQETLFTLSAGHYKYESGTSMAAPFVAGAVGLLKSKYPDLNWRDVKASILMNGDILPSLQNQILTESRLNLLSMLRNPIKDVSENMGISLAEGGTVEVSFPEKSFSIENPRYIFVENPISLNILLDNDYSAVNVKFNFISFDYGLKPAVCYDNDGKCYVMDNDAYLISTQDVKPYVSIYIEDNSIYDADNEVGKIHLNIAFVKLKNIDDNESQISSSGGGCSLSNRNDISLILLLVLMPAFFLGRRFLFQGD